MLYLFSIVHTLHILQGNLGACQSLASILQITFQYLTLQL